MAGLETATASEAAVLSSFRKDDTRIQISQVEDIHLTDSETEGTIPGRPIPASFRKPHIVPRRNLRCSGEDDARSVTTFHLENGAASQSEIIQDYGRAEGGRPVFQIANVTSTGDEVEFRVFYSETIREIDHETGDGPFFLFSNAMDSYRAITHKARTSKEPQEVRARHAQRSQRYQKIRLLTPNSRIHFESIGIDRLRPEVQPKASFECSDNLLNQIWRQGVRTVDMCTVHENETDPAWDVTQDGTRVYGQHWAPCRKGTRWTDMTACFEVKIDEGGASWAVHMVANGLIFCLDRQKRMLSAFEGLSHESSVFPAHARGSWQLKDDFRLEEWLVVICVAAKDSVRVSLNGHEVASISELNVHPLLGGAPNNAGSIAFGGPEGWIATYRNLHVSNCQGKELYRNSLGTADAERTFADFAVGTNPLACTMDGAKRDRATFGGDLHIMGRSIAYSTAAFAAVRGSIDLLSSHQTRDGYLGNLCSIQAPSHAEDEEPPTYAFYSLTYALQLVVAVKDYWLHTGDCGVVRRLWPKFERLMSFAEGFVNDLGLVEAPPPLSLTFFPLVGPVFGVSAQINLAFYDALQSMALMRPDLKSLNERSDVLRLSIQRHLWDQESGIMRLSNTSSPGGMAQDTAAYAVLLGLSPPHPKDEQNLTQPDRQLPSAFLDLGERFDKLDLCSPYSTGFAAEALFKRSLGQEALDLIRRVWGVMADSSNPDFSGCHWEAVTLAGKPYHNTTSLVHGWSTSPVFLLPMYLAGLRPVAPGWKRWEAKPAYAGLERVRASVPTPSGKISIEWNFEDGHVCCQVPEGLRGEIYPPDGWELSLDELSDAFSANPVSIMAGCIRRALRRC